VNHVHDGTQGGYISTVYNDATWGPYWRTVFYRGSQASPAAIVDNDYLWYVEHYAYDGSGVVMSTQIQCRVDGTVSTGIVPSEILFRTQNTSGTVIDALRARASGNIEVSRGDLTISSGKGITHADGNAAGNVLRADGTRYIPGTLAMGDLSDAAYAAPALTLGTSNVEGVADTVMRTDATILAFDATNPVAIDAGNIAAPGAASVAARRDHTHAVTATFDASATPSELLKADSNGYLWLARLYIDNYLVHDGDGDTYLFFQTDTINFYAGNVNLLQLVEDTQDQILINSAGGDADTQIKASGITHALFVQGSDGYVGINDSSPSAWLDVNATDTSDIISAQDNGTQVWRVPDGSVGRGDSHLLQMTAYEVIPYQITTASGTFSVFVGVLLRDCTLVDWYQSIYVETTNDGSNYWTINLLNAAGTAKGAQISTSASSADTWLRLSQTGQSVSLTASTDKILYLRLSYVGSPGTISLGGPAVWLR
jgi:hypothetical protein